MLLSAILALTGFGCQTSKSYPYEASPRNVAAIKQALEGMDVATSISGVNLAPGVEDNPHCGQMGPLRVAPGVSLPEYIEDAFNDAFSEAGVYEAGSDTAIFLRIRELAFSPESPPYWDISMQVSSGRSTGYAVSIRHDFKFSLTEYRACRKTESEFGPAVQKLVHEVVAHEEFAELFIK